MLKSLLSFVIFALPLSASAIEFENLSLLYTDAPFLPAESAGISVLTGVGAIKGNPDGTFRPNRLLNRAEFLKIALLSNPKIRVSKSDAGNCFPDVRRTDWFSSFVCLAKKRGAVAGYPDGTFKPERTVNYAEALKMLGELYDYNRYATPDEPWFMGYVRQAQFYKTILPIAIAYDRPLSRGQMARLAAAFRAAYDGQIELYRLAERDIGKAMVAQREETKKEEEIGKIKAEEAPEEPTPVVTRRPFEATSHLLLLGTRSSPIAEATYYPPIEDREIRIFKVEFEKKYKSIESVFLIDDAGKEIGELRLDVYDTDDVTWILLFDQGSGVVLPAKTGTKLLVTIQVKKRGRGGVPEELIKVKRFSLTTGSLNIVDTGISAPSNAKYPFHQTVQGLITGVFNATNMTGDLKTAERVIVAEFTFEGSALPETEVAVEHLRFIVDAKGVGTSNWKLGAFWTPVKYACSIENATTVNCSGIPIDYGRLKDGFLRLRLFADIGVEEAESDPHLQIRLQSAGSIGELGAMRWTDGSGHFTWVELAEPLAEGTLLR